MSYAIVSPPLLQRRLLLTNKLNHIYAHQFTDAV